MQVKKCEGTSVGVTISNYDAKQAQNIEEIKHLLYENKIVIFKDQKMDEKQFCDFSAALGNPVPYLQKNYHHPQYPLIFVSSNVKKDGQQIGVPRTGGYWHSDTAFLEKPIPLTLLYPQLVPQKSRRTTLFIDMEQAWSEMPAELQNRLANLSFIHSGKWRYKVKAEDAGMDIYEILQMIHKVAPPVIHPAVITHPANGRKVIYATRGFTIGVHDMSTDEGNALLEEMFDFVEQPRFIKEFQWSLGDMILWDNRYFAHKAGRLRLAEDPDGGSLDEEETIVYRIIIEDAYPLSSKGQAA